MSDFHIEKGVPMPKNLRQRGESKYPWPDMQVGDSVFFPGKSSYEIVLIGARAADWGKKHGASFARRSVDGGVRFWRVG